MLKLLLFCYVEIEYHILELVEVKMILWTIYITMDYQCVAINYLLNNLFKYILNISIL
jgi:hypothetical protein